MYIFISLDYEVFFGEPSADIHPSLIDSSMRFHEILDKHKARGIFFVDAGYLFALNRQKAEHKKLAQDFDTITKQLVFLDQQGHEIGLHVHPHWEDCFFDGHKWQMDLRRYKHADFSPAEASAIFKKYYQVLQPYSSRQIISYRAGGWCLEPFGNIREALKECGIYIDSTVYPDGYYKSATHSFDFRHYPKKDFWRFTTDPSVEDPRGAFLELPFTAHKLPPVIFWKELFDRLLRKTKKTGEGHAVKPSIKAILQKLFLKTTDAISIDSFKSDMLLKSFKRKEKEQGNYCCIIGHPKLFTPVTYKNLEQFIEYAISKGHSIGTFSQCFEKAGAKDTTGKFIHQ